MRRGWVGWGQVGSSGWMTVGWHAVGAAESKRRRQSADFLESQSIRQIAQNPSLDHMETDLCLLFHPTRRARQCQKCTDLILVTESSVCRLYIEHMLGAVDLFVLFASQNKQVQYSLKLVDPAEYLPDTRTLTLAKDKNNFTMTEVRFRLSVGLTDAVSSAELCQI